MAHFENELLDAQFVDDMGIYADGSPSNSRKIRNALAVCSKASGSKIDCNKTLAFWPITRLHPSWTLDKNFRWTPSGKAMTYMGCKVGIPNAPKAQIAAL